MLQCCTQQMIKMNEIHEEWSGDVIIFDVFFCPSCYGLRSVLRYVDNLILYEEAAVAYQQFNTDAY